MSIKQRLTKLEQIADQPGEVDVAAVILATREAYRAGKPIPRSPCPPEWEHSRDPIKKRIFAARRRSGIHL